MKHDLTTRLAWRAVGALVIVCHLAGPALAQTAGAVAQRDIAAAEDQAARAYDAYLANDYAAAIRLYLAAYAAAPDPDILYNVARIYETGLRDRSKASQFYRQFVADRAADPARIALASARLQALESSERAEPPPERSPSARSPAPPAPGDRAPHLGSTLAEAAPIAAPRAPVNSWSAWRAGALIAGSTGLVALSVGAVFGIRALSKAQTVHDECDGNVCATARGITAARSAGQAADIATMSFAVGGLLVVTSATLLGIDLGAPGEPGSPALAHWTASVTTADVRLGFTGNW